jgi:hypothetical protein
MADWEEELESVETTPQVEKKITSTIQESEDIIKPKIEFKPQSNEPKENVNDYERKWQEKNKDLLDRKKREEMALEGLDEKEKQKRMIDKRIIDDASDFLAGEKTASRTNVDQIAPLITEKDFIDLAVKNISRIKEANKPSKFTFTYLKNSLDLLAPTLDGDKLDQLIKDLTFLFNKKRKEDSEKAGKKPAAKAKPSVSAGKGLDRAEKMGAFEDFGVKEDFDGDEDYYEDDFI